MIGPSSHVPFSLQFNAALHESAFGTKRTWCSRSAMSAFGGKADIVRALVNVRD